MSACRCSARTPTEKGLHSMGSSIRRSMAKVSPRAVTHRQDQPAAGDLPRRRDGGGQAAVLHPQAGERRVEMHRAAQALDLPADGGDNAPQQVGAHVGFLPPGDVRRRAVVQKRPGDKGAQRVPHPRGELAVREGPRAALAKLEVGGRVQKAGLLKPLHGGDALFQRRAALQHDGRYPCRASSSAANSPPGQGRRPPAGRPAARRPPGSRTADCG